MCFPAIYGFSRSRETQSKLAVRGGNGRTFASFSAVFLKVTSAAARGSLSVTSEHEFISLGSK